MLTKSVFIVKCFAKWEISIIFNGFYCADPNGALTKHKAFGKRAFAGWISTNHLAINPLIGFLKIYGFICRSSVMFPCQAIQS